MRPRRTCTRCNRRPAILTSAQAWVKDALQWDHLLEEVLLCGFCRSDAAAENSKAFSRRTGADWNPRL